MNPDPWGDRAQRNRRIATVALALMFYCFAYAMAWFAYGPALGFAVCAPILGGYLAWLLVHRADAWLFFPKWMALRHFNGTRHFSMIGRSVSKHATAGAGLQRRTSSASRDTSPPIK